MPFSPLFRRLRRRKSGARAMAVIPRVDALGYTYTVPSGLNNRLLAVLLLSNNSNGYQETGFAKYVFIQHNS
jgi:hypothetical protein